MPASRLAELVANHLVAKEADLFVFSGDIEDESAEEFVSLLCAKQNRAKNAIWFLTTLGGDPHAAYRIGKALRTKYKHVRLLLAGPCKSAGTLIALGAHHIAFGPMGELGPLDIQLSKPDELLLQGSGLDVLQSLTMITDSAFQAFETFLIRLVSRSSGRVSTKTAADVAERLSAQLYEPVMAQIDPLRLGEVKRAISIARAYGERLSVSPGGSNLKSGALDTLIEEYPSHGFVIDLDEARKLFNHVSELDDTESNIAELIGPLVRTPSSSAIILDLGKELSPPAEQPDAETEPGNSPDPGEDVQGEPSDPRSHGEGGAAAPAAPSTTGELAVERLLRSL